MHEDEVFTTGLTHQTGVGDVAVEVAACLLPQTFERGGGTCEMDASKVLRLGGHLAYQGTAAWKEVVDCEVCGTLEKAVERAMREAANGEKVLLSPGAASFDQFKNFEERGEVFAQLVKGQGKGKT